MPSLKENDKIKVCPEKKHNHANYLFLPELTGNAMANISVIIWGRNRRLMIRRDRHLISIPLLGTAIVIDDVWRDIA